MKKNTPRVIRNREIQAQAKSGCCIGLTQNVFSSRHEAAELSGAP